MNNHGVPAIASSRVSTSDPPSAFLAGSGASANAVELESETPVNAVGMRPATPAYAVEMLSELSINAAAVGSCFTEMHSEAALYISEILPIKSV